MTTKHALNEVEKIFGPRKPSQLSINLWQKRVKLEKWSDFFYSFRN
jgi:hypothetical protein